jgi:hypothetical protein
MLVFTLTLKLPDYDVVRIVTVIIISAMQSHYHCSKYFITRYDNYKKIFNPNLAHYGTNFNGMQYVLTNGKTDCEL